MPWIPRDLLAPAQVAETIGNVEAMDHFLTHNPTIQNGENPDNEPRWIDVCQYSNDMLQRVVGQTVEEFDVKGYEREVTPRILLNEDVWFIPSHIIRLYDAILLRLEDESLAPPKLLPRLTSLRDEPLRPLLDENQRVEKSAQHLGYMEWRHPLSVSQREAVDHFLTLSDGEILAINGPPGTGKTTLLQSVVASLWVEAALHEREPPVIFASSSNNQAVTNVIDSFGDVPEDKSLLRGRWIPELKSYGLFCPSSSRAQEALDRQYQITTSWPNPSGFFLPPNSEKWTGGNIEDEAFISLAEQYFLDHCRDYMKSCGNMSVVNVKDAVRLLHRQLEEKINAIYQGVQTWLQVERIKTELSDRYGSRGGIETHLTQCANDLEVCQKEIVQYREAQRGWLDHVDTVLSFFKQLVKGARNQEQGFAEKLRQAGRDWRDHADTILSFFKQRVKEAGNQERDFAEKLHQIQTGLSDLYGSRGGIETRLTQCANDLETCQKKIVQSREVQQGWLDHVDTVIPFFKQLVKGARNQEQGFAEKLRQAGRDWRDHADTILSFFKQRVKEAGNQERDFAEKLHQIQTGLSDLYGGGHRGIETRLTQCANDLEICQKKIVQYREVQQGWLDHVDTVIPFFKQLVKGARNQEQGFAEKLRQAGRDWRDHADTILSFFEQRVKEAGNQERDFAEKLHQIQTGLSDLYGSRGGIETRLTQCANDLEICQKKIVQYREVQQGWLDHVDTVIPFFKQLVKGARNQEQGFAEKLRQAGRDWRDHADTILSFFEQRVKEAGNQERDFAEKLHQIQTGLSDLYGSRGGIETHLTQCVNDLETCQKKIVQYREAQQGWLDHVDTMPWWMTLFGFLPWVKGRIEIRNRRYLLSIRSTCLVDPLDIKGIMDFFDGCVKEAENQERDCAERLHQIERDWRDHADTIFSFFDGCVKEAENQERDCAERLHQVERDWRDHADTIFSFFDGCVKEAENQERGFIEKLRQVERDWRDHADTIFSFFDGCVKEAENQERGFIEKLRQVERDWRDYAGTILSFFEQRIKDVRNQEQGFAEKLRQAKRDWARLQREEQAWDAWCAQHEFSTDRSSLLDTMDTRLRYTAFKLATHYWEGRWLLEMREQFNTDYKESQSEKKQKKRWRRYAKLAPCFVSTLYTLPNLMHAFNGKHVTLFDFIDLLIIDEAGQVSPDVSGATFALAKKALVVGDMQQIEPIWGITESIDIGNLREKKVVSTGDEDEISAFFSTGLAASSGNLMKVAQRASPYQKSDERGLFERGMFLTEHRRCVPEIIQYCNRLAYGGRLIPMRESEVDYPLPHLGYAHISGQSRRVGGSRDNRDEATVIVRWIAEHRDMLASHYSEKSLSLDQIVAIVTPFRPQANLLQGLLKKSGITESLKVGTVHILQGAECPVVIFSPVYGSNDRPPYFFDRDNSMLNVAVSRAQDSFLVFGNMNNFDQEASSKPSGILASFLFRDEGNEITQAASGRDLLIG